MSGSRLAGAFADARGRTGLIPFVTAGYPTLETSRAMLRGFDRVGALALEIGIPFSDPIADGPEIQRSSEAALANGVGVAEVLALVRDLRSVSELPVVLMTYANPVLRFGAQRFARDAKTAGVDGVLISDLPPNEAPETWEAFDAADLDTVVLVAPTTDDARLPRLVARARGFVYCLARTGVTGQSPGTSGPLAERIAALRKVTTLPVAVGFGISTPDDARALRGLADALVVGSALMRAASAGEPESAGTRVLQLAAELSAAL